MDEYAPIGHLRPTRQLTFELLEDRSLPSSLATMLADFRPPPGLEAAWSNLVAKAPALIAQHDRLHVDPIPDAADARNDATHVAALADAKSDATHLAALAARDPALVGPAVSLLAWAQRLIEARAADHLREEPSLSPDHFDHSRRNPPTPAADPSAPAPAAGNPPDTDSAATGPAQHLATVPAGRSSERAGDPLPDAGEADCRRRPAADAPGAGPAANARAPARAELPDDGPAPDLAAAPTTADDVRAQAEDDALPLLGGVSVDLGAVERGADELLSLLGSLVEDCGEWLPAVTNLGCVAMSAAVAAELARLWRRQAARKRDEPPPDPLLPLPEGTA